ncbi:hypothetical protein [Actibacterium mucosum]|nr:hypothetical protein [Actibacterium mucosum]
MSLEYLLVVTLGIAVVTALGLIAQDIVSFVSTEISDLTAN